MLDRECNAIDRMCYHLKDFRCIATRYDRLATDYLAIICPAASLATGCEFKARQWESEAVTFKPQFDFGS
ncbi:hypothetical protein SAMN04487845_1516 [Methylobacterium sp. yr668]|nr:hypothetical protein SAMN04487845_1516 [Methylobacterium sp. yr668]